MHRVSFIKICSEVSTELILKMILQNRCRRHRGGGEKYCQLVYYQNILHLSSMLRHHKVAAM